MPKFNTLPATCIITQDNTHARTRTKTPIELSILLNPYNMACTIKIPKTKIDISFTLTDVSLSNYKTQIIIIVIFKIKFLDRR